MTKRHHILAAIFLTGVLGMVAWWALRTREPIYEGRSLTSWLVNSDPFFIHSRDKITAVVRQAGTNAIPVLLRMMQARDSVLKSKFIGLTHMQHFVEISPLSAYEERSRAIYAFKRMGTDASKAVPALIKLYDRDLSILGQSTIARALGNIGPAAKQAVPSLLNRGTNPNLSVRASAIYALGQIHCDPEQVVPLLTKSLADTNAWIRWRAARGLKAFGADAKPAVPALVALFKSWDPNWRSAAKAARDMDQYGIQDEFTHGFTSGEEVLAVEQALAAIDTEAAATAGVREEKAAGTAFQQ